VRITTKGQVTIPQEIREKLGLHPNTDVEFRIDGDTVVMTKTSAKRRADQLLELMTGALDGCGMTTDEIMAMTRDWEPPPKKRT
jgi:AbrB family looped-hinge helix DNA binding protein